MSLSRNLRDGQVTVKDNTGTPISLTLTLDQGDLKWTETLDTKQISNRGVLSHTRPGNQQSCKMSFSAKWYQLISKTISSAASAVLYEMINDTGGSTFTSTSGTGEQYTLKYVFLVTDPEGLKTETITFNKVFKETLDLSEGDEHNLISFTGVDFETAPVITHA